MMSASLQTQSNIYSDLPAQQSPQDHYTLLLKAIADLSNDPARLRKIVYALALQDLQPDAAPDEFIPEPTKQAKTLLELEQALQFELAIEQMEKHAASDTVSGVEPSLGQPTASAFETSPQDCSSTWPRHDSASYLVPLPAFLDPCIRAATDAFEAAPPPSFAGPRPRLKPLAQCAAAAAVIAALYVVVAGWFQAGRPPISSLASANLSPKQAIIALHRPETVGRGTSEWSRRRQAAPAFSFPLPTEYGVYAVSNRRIAALEKLAVDIPTARLQTSAQITTPSRTSVADGNLKFVVFKPDLAKRTPEQASVRVVARVAHALTFVDGRATVTPVASEWRIRDKAYQVTVSPLKDNPEMVVVEPAADFSFSPGRYALVLGDEAYDFTIAGLVTALEQCLEQFQVQNGVVLSDCPRS